MMKQHFHLPFISFLLMAGMGCQNTGLELTEKQWKKIVRENSELTVQEILPKGKITRLSNEKIWIDFNHEKLCGMSHCLYAIYQVNSETETAKLQWRSYLDPRLPRDVSLMEKGENNCILINQFQNKQIETYELCPKNGQYQLTRKLSKRG